MKSCVVTLWPSFYYTLLLGGFIHASGSIALCPQKSKMGLQRVFNWQAQWLHLAFAKKTCILITPCILLYLYICVCVCTYICICLQSCLPLKWLLYTSPISGGVTALCWDPIQRVLFSGSSDHSIIMWDIGGRKGTAIELQGHKYVQRPSSCFCGRKAKGRSNTWKQTAQRLQPSQASSFYVWLPVVHMQQE